MLGPRQGDDERGAETDFTLQVNVAAQGIDNLFHQPEPNAETDTRVTGAGAFEPLED
jgi:hypothetical protein